LKKIYDLFRLTRPANVLIAVLSVLLAAGLSGSLDPIHDVTLAVISAALVMMGSNIINDIYDINIDRINKPGRPIAAGSVTVQEAYYLFFAVNIIALICAFIISMMMMLIALLVILLLVLYSSRFKRTVIWGNLVVSTCTAAAFIYGGLAVGRIDVVLFPAVFAFLFHFGREIIKDIEDIEGDRREGAKTLAIRYGPQIAARLILFVFVVLVVVTILPYILNIYNGLYMTIVILGIYPILTIVWYQAHTNPVPSKMGMMSQLLKVDMLVGLAAIYLG